MDPAKEQSSVFNTLICNGVLAPFLAMSASTREQSQGMSDKVFLVASDGIYRVHATFKT